jgi:hypothetical protein
LRTIWFSLASTDSSGAVNVVPTVMLDVGSIVPVVFTERGTDAEVAGAEITVTSGVSRTTRTGQA